MPRPTLPPTPGSSSDIKGKDGPQFGQISFELPPPALMSGDSRPSSASTKYSSASSYHPASPKSPAVSPTTVQSSSRRRPSTAHSHAKDDFNLPPPPTRSRKIIQMKPRGQMGQSRDLDSENSKVSAPKGTTGVPNKKKQPSATSVAGRKIARKTAHSLIERRRRSKMNEEFGVLKDMIPACKGEMHKLAILQASIDYVRYLEECVTKLKKQNGRRIPTPSATQEDYMPAPPVAPDDEGPEYYNTYVDEDDDNDDDVEMVDSSAPSPDYTAHVPPSNHSHHPSISPALPPKEPQQHAPSSTKSRQPSYSSITSQRHYSYSAATTAIITSNTTSPGFDPRGTYDYTFTTSASNSTLPSPALLPQQVDSANLDQEATAALLMLNTDRRGAGPGKGMLTGRGMSVKDLLTT